MAHATDAARRAGRRAIGVRAGLNLTRILEAARSLDPDTLTMQALADELGVDRKALNHHIGDRETLLGLVAMETFTEAFTAVDIGAHTRWQEACRSYARGFTDSVITVGALADRIRLDDPYVTSMLEPTEAVLKKLVEADFSDATAMRLLAMLTNICLAYARDTVIAARSGVTPRPVLLRKALEQRDPAEFETLARIAVLPVSTYDRAQLELSIEIFVLGAEAILRRAKGLD